MPQEPKRRHSRQRQGKRRAHIKLSLPTFSICPNCQKPIRPHTVCPNCGFYGGKQVLQIKTKKAKKVQSQPTSEK